MRAILPAAVAFVLGLPATSAAHRLDEYLQAARVSVAIDHVALEIDLTPGVSIAREIAALVDGDGNGVVSPQEAEAYARLVLRDLVVEIDHRPVGVVLTRVEIPTIEEILDGMGTIQLRLSAPIDAVTRARRQLYFRNDHRPGGSVYLVNALVPETRDLVITAQRRDSLQREIDLGYEIQADSPIHRWLWLLVGAGALCTLAGCRRTWGTLYSPCSR